MSDKIDVTIDQYSFRCGETVVTARRVDPAMYGLPWHVSWYGDPNLGRLYDEDEGDLMRRDAAEYAQRVEEARLAVEAAEAAERRVHRAFDRNGEA